MVSISHRLISVVVTVLIFLFTVMLLRRANISFLAHLCRHELLCSPARSRPELGTEKTEVEMR